MSLTSTANLNKPILQMKGITKTFPGVQALTNVDFTLNHGEIHGLVGKNGAGKSTLMAILMGIREPDAGEICIYDHTVKAMTPNEAVKSGVAYVPQHVNQMDPLTVAENILAGDLPKDRFGFIRWKEAYRDVEIRLKNLGLSLNVRNKVEGLSVAEQTMLAIAKALFGHATLIILDEPTASLPRADVDRLFSFIRTQKKEGVSFIYISHHLEEVFEICDTVTILRDGQLAGVRKISEITLSHLVRLLVGENVKEFKRDSTIENQTVLELRDLTRRGHYEGINISVKRGEIIGISGLQGCGAETLGKGLFAMEKWGIGKILINGKKLTARNPKEAFKQGIAYLPQDRYRFGLIANRTVRENITYPILSRFQQLFGFLNERNEKAIVSQFIDELGIKTPSQEQCSRLLSGGNQQKVVFAKLAATKPSLLILHEPTQGIDVRAKQDIFRIISELGSQGVAVIIVSSEVRELIGICDRIMVMFEGRITHEFKKGDAKTTPANILIAIEGDNESHGKKR
jgi:ABC-type sugar transport system ATPase subunit